MTPYGAKIVSASNYYDYWVKSYNEKFYDLGTLIRLGTEIENGLKYYYMEKKKHANLLELHKDSKYKLGVFQRIMPWNKDCVIDLYNSEIGYDLNSNPEITNIQKIMS